MPPPPVLLELMGASLSVKVLGHLYLCQKPLARGSHTCMMAQTPFDLGVSVGSNCGWGACVPLAPDDNCLNIVLFLFLFSPTSVHSLERIVVSDHWGAIHRLCGSR